MDVESYIISLLLHTKIASEYQTRGGMHNEGVPLHSNVMPILVAAQCYWMRKIWEFPPLRRNEFTPSLCMHTTLEGVSLRRTSWEIHHATEE